jgi:hypothetical protein
LRLGVDFDKPFAVPQPRQRTKLNAPAHSIGSASERKVRSLWKITVVLLVLLIMFVVLIVVLSVSGDNARQERLLQQCADALEAAAAGGEIKLSGPLRLKEATKEFYFFEFKCGGLRPIKRSDGYFTTIDSLHIWSARTNVIGQKLFEHLLASTDSSWRVIDIEMTVTGSPDERLFHLNWWTQSRESIEPRREIPVCRRLHYDGITSLGKIEKFRALLRLSDYYNSKYREARETHYSFNIRCPDTEFLREYIHAYGEKQKFQPLVELLVDPRNNGTRDCIVAITTDESHGSDKIFTLLPWTEAKDVP